MKAVLVSALLATASAFAPAPQVCRLLIVEHFDKWRREDIMSHGHVPLQQERGLCAPISKKRRLSSGIRP